jgi:hypothetical protein
MNHFIIVLSIILSVSLIFFYPSIENAQDGSFNDYEYLQKLRRTRSDVNTDDKTKGWQEDGTFKSWYQPGNGSENDKALNNIKIPSSNDQIPSNTVSSTSSVPSNASTVPNTSKSSSDETTKETKPSLNIVPYLLLVLLLMIIILVVYIKYKYV